jgi:hypothetical protein
MTHLGLGDLDAIDAMGSGEAHVAVLSESDREAVEHLDSRPEQFTRVPAIGPDGANSGSLIAMPASFADCEFGRQILGAIENGGGESQ